MDTRQKLVELCEDVILSCKSSLCNDCEHNGIDYPNCMGVHFADHLIAHGVTVQEWISVKDRLPEKTGRYLTANKRAGDEIRVFDLWFDCGEWYVDENDDEFIYKVTHWMPLPSAPKGE